MFGSNLQQGSHRLTMMQKAREPRRSTLRPARMRAGGEWCDITICNVSSRGFMAKCASPPCRGTYVEVRQGRLCIVARVVWAGESRFGVRAQDKIDIALLLEETSRPARPGEERRQASRDRATRSPRHADTRAAAEASRRFARAFEWTTLTLAVAAAAVMVFQMATASLTRPLREVRNAMEGKPGADPETAARQP